jgi:hypothetical protein
MRIARISQTNKMDSNDNAKRIHWNPRPRTRPGLHLKTQKLPYQRPVINRLEFTARAIMVAERIDVKVISSFEVIAKSPFMIRLGGGGIAALFRYGAVVLFNASEEEKARLLGAIAAHSSGPGDIGAEEVAEIQVNPDEEEGPSLKYIKIKNADRLRLQLIAEVMAKATMLSFQERRAAHDFDRTEPLARDLAEDGKFSAKPAELLKAVGSMLLAESRLARSAVGQPEPVGLVCAARRRLRTAGPRGGAGPQADDAVAYVGNAGRNDALSQFAPAGAGDSAADFRGIVPRSLWPLPALTVQTAGIKFRDLK